MNKNLDQTEETNFEQNCLLELIKKLNLENILNQDKVKEYEQKLNLFEFLDAIEWKYIKKFLLVPDVKEKNTNISAFLMYLKRKSIEHNKLKNTESIYVPKTYNTQLEAFDYQIYITYFYKHGQLTAHAQYFDKNEKCFIDQLGDIFDSYENKKTIYGFLLGLSVKEKEE